MKLIFLYGPPASGKLTIAEELAKITGYKIFHNHLSIDLVLSIFESGTKEYSDLSGKIRLEVLKSSIQARVAGIIFTFAYGVETYGGKDDEFIKKVIKLVKKHGGEILFVKLSADKKELRKRIISKSRKKFRKLTNVKIFDSLDKKCDWDKKISFVRSLLIDTTKSSPKKSANDIKKHYKL